jgi:hypothetical protein
MTHPCNREPTCARLAVLLAALALIPIVRAQPAKPAPDLIAAMRRFDALYRSGSSVARLEMTVTAGGRTRNVRMQAFTRGQDKALVVIEEPARDKGTANVLKQLGSEELHTLLKNAKALPVFHTRTAHLLARDDEGTYYFVDELRSEYGGNGYRVFAGQKGAMKELAMTNVVSDSAGEIFATKGGQLKIISTSAKGSDAGKTYWLKGGKKTELTMLEPTDNRYLIYRELGIYGSLGAVCDDL